MDADDSYQYTKLEYVYLIREREHVRLNENTYKIGKTTQTPNQRLSGYPKYTEILLFESVDDCTNAENIIIKRFDETFHNQTQYGREYYKGDVGLMKLMMHNICSELLYMKTCVKLISKPTIHADVIEHQETLNIELEDELIPVISQTNTDIVFSDPADLSLKSFYRFIYSSRPAWYLENSYIHFQQIVNAYRLHFNDDETSSSMISRQLNGSLFITSTRINGITKKKIVSYDTLLALC
jgi:hypothetical protein